MPPAPGQFAQPSAPPLPTGPQAKLTGPPEPPPLPAPKPVSYVPLIIILNVLLLAAIALVLYFVLKPH
jgi:hypothetical protein